MCVLLCGSFANAAETNPPATEDARLARLADDHAALRGQYTKLVHTAREVFEGLKDENKSLRARLAALEAKPVPFTPEELALLRRPATNPLAQVDGQVANDARQLAAAAQRAFADHDFDTAHEKYLAVLQLDPKSVFALGNLATVELEIDKTNEAESHLRQALAILPEDAFCLGTLGNLCFREGRYDAALDALSRAAVLTPEDPQVQNFLGLTLCQKGQRTAAEAALRKAVQIDPNYASAHNNLAVIYLTQSPPQVELARWHYQKALAVGKLPNPELEKLLEASEHSGDAAK